MRASRPRERRAGRRFCVRRDSGRCWRAYPRRGNRALRSCRRPGEQRRNGALARSRRRAGRGLAGRLGDQRDGLSPADACGRARDAQAGMGPGGECVEHGGQKAFEEHARVLGRESRSAVAVKAVRRPPGWGGSARERDLPGTDQVRNVGRGRRPCRPVRGARRLPRPG